MGEGRAGKPLEWRSAPALILTTLQKGARTIIPSAFERRVNITRAGPVDSRAIDLEPMRPWQGSGCSKPLAFG